MRNSSTQIYSKRWVRCKGRVETELSFMRDVGTKVAGGKRKKENIIGALNL